MRFLTLSLVLSILSANAAKAAEPYAFDPSHTSIGYSIDHMGLSEMHGVFRKFEGSLLLDTKNISASKVEVKIDVSSIDTGIDKLDEHLRAADFFNAAEFPHITFSSTKVEPIAETYIKDSTVRPTPETNFKVTGDLNLHGVTKPVTLNVKMRTIDSHMFHKVPAAGFLATGVIKRSDFGINAYPGALGELVNIRIDTETFQNLPKPAVGESKASKK